MRDAWKFVALDEEWKRRRTDTKLYGKVRLATHLNAKGQPQVSFIDRLNNRAVDPRSCVAKYKLLFSHQSSSKFNFCAKLKFCAKFKFCAKCKFCANSVLGPALQNTNFFSHINPKFIKVQILWKSKGRIISCPTLNLLSMLRS